MDEIVFDIKPICHYYDGAFEEAFQIKLHDLETIHLRTYKFSKDDCWDTPLNFPNGIVDGIRKIKRLKCAKKIFTTLRLFKKFVAKFDEDIRLITIIISRTT